MPEIKDDLFIITKLNVSGGDIIANLDLNGKSEIFKGHFPNQPVVPGACMVQLVKTVFETALKNNFRLKKAGQIKFMSMIVPQNTLQLRLNITFKLAEDESYNLAAKLINGDAICFKFYGNFVRADALKFI